MSGFVVFNGSGHVDDGALMALLDGEVAATRAAKEHLAACDTCRERMGVLERAGAVFRSALPPVAIPAMRLPARRRLRWSYPAIAAASVLVVASVAAATPVASWIMQRLNGPAGSSVTTEPATPASPATAAGVIASFAPSDSVLIIRIAQRQASGSMHLVAATSDRVTAQAISGSDAEELIVMPGQLHIANRPTSTADYRIGVPAGVQLVRVIVGGIDVATVRYDTRLSRTIPLR